MKSLLHGWLLAVAVLFASLSMAAAQSAPATDPKSEESAAVEDPFGRSSPRGTVQGYLAAVGDGDFEKAARFLDVSYQPLAERKKIGTQRAEELKQVLDRNGSISDVSLLSTLPTGAGNDELEIDFDQVGMLDRSDRQIPLLVQRVDGGENGKIWLFAAKSVKRVPFLVQVTEEGILDRIMPDTLKTKKIGSVSIAHWIAVILVAVLSLFMGFLISRFIIRMLRTFVLNRTSVPGHGALAGMVVPLGFLIGLSIYRLAILNLGVDVVARESIDRFAVILGWVALAWLGMRFVDGAADVARYSMTRTNQITSVAVIMLIKRLAKAAIFAIASIMILDAIGIDVTTGLAALGIGGLALALGAQKTIENLVGSVTVVIDKPVRVGDYCRFGTVSGTVEDIGIRSTRIRTLDRTIVTVPNGAFAAMEIENYALRDEIKFDFTLNMRYETTPDQMRYLLSEIRMLLNSHEWVSNDPARVRFVNLGAHSLDIILFCYIKTNNYGDFLEIQEDLLLRIMDIVKASGTDFAFPTQTLHLGKDVPPDESNAKKISKVVRKIAAEDEMSLRQVDEEKAKQVDGSIKLKMKKHESDEFKDDDEDGR